MLYKEATSEVVTSEFQEKLNQIFSRKMTADNFATFFDDIFDEIVAFVEETVSKYESQSNEVFTNKSIKEIEDEAFEFFGLPDINEIINDVIRRKDILEDIVQYEGLILPPSGLRGKITGSGKASYEEKTQLIPRRQLIEYILRNNNVEYTLIAGEVPPDNMMRQEPYFALFIPSLNRLVLVCDQASNATFIFDTSSYPSEEVKNAIPEILSRSKDEMEELGVPYKALPYKRADNWVNNVEILLFNPIDEFNASNIPEVETGELSPWKNFYLDRETGKYYGSTRQISLRLKCTQDRVKKIIEKHNISPYNRLIVSSSGLPDRFYPLDEIEKIFNEEEPDRVNIISDPNDELFRYAIIDGKKYASTATIAEEAQARGLRGDVSLSRLVGVLNEHAIAKGVRPRVGFYKNKETKIFSLDEMIEYLEETTENIKDAVSVISDTSDPNYNFYVSQDGVLYGAIYIIAERLKIENNSPKGARWISEKLFEHIEDQHIDHLDGRDRSNRKIQLYNYEEMSKYFSTLDTSRKPRKS